MKIFSDLHHTDLYASFHYLFEKRLGHELYRPIGNEWFDQGYWKIAEPYGNHIPTIDQYLKVNSIPSDGTPQLNKTEKEQEGVHYIWDGNRDFHQKAITLDKFLEMDFDVIIASIPAHVKAYKKLIKDNNLKAKLIYHIGNIGWHEEIPWMEVDNLMASVKEFPIKQAGKNVIFYRQEFDLKIFSPAKGKPKQKITSFVNVMPLKSIWEDFKRWLPGMNWVSHGIGAGDGIVSDINELAGIMRESKFGYHFKPHGDGYGHVIHNWFAVGRPVLVGMVDYKDKLAGELMEDLVTCIDISDRTPEQLVAVLKMIDYDEMCDNVRQRFNEVVDFERDAELVKEFLKKLI